MAMLGMYRLCHSRETSPKSASKWLGYKNWYRSRRALRGGSLSCAHDFRGIEIVDDIPLTDQLRQRRIRLKMQKRGEKTPRFVS
jgi:hypothetical protein